MRFVRSCAGTSQLLGIIFALVPSLWSDHATAQQAEIPGWVTRPTRVPFTELVTRLESAVNAHQMGVVNFASASDGAKAQGFTIPGNRVVGVFRNDFARRLIPLNPKAGIEAPIRFYLTEGSDGLGTLSYRRASAVLEPYYAGSSSELQGLAKELDVIFDAIADDAVRQ